MIFGCENILCGILDLNLGHDTLHFMCVYLVCLFCINYQLVFFFNIKNLLFSAVNSRVSDGSIIYQWYRYLK